MQEAEVSLRMAMYHISKGLTRDNVMVSIDGAHIKVRNKVIFDIGKFFEQNSIVKIEGSENEYKGIYRYADYDAKIEITPKSGIGDVNIRLDNDKTLYVESKKGKPNKSCQENVLMHEAIGQLMTGCELSDNVIPAVAVPYSEKTLSLSQKWIELSQMKKIGIRFYLVKDDGDIVVV